MDINRIQDELDERAEDEEEKDTSDETEWSTNSKYDSKQEEDEAECNSECESIATIDYEFPVDKKEEKYKSVDKKIKITESAKKGKAVDENTEKVEYNVVERITFQTTPPGSTGSRRRGTPTSTRSSRASSPELRSTRKSRPKQSPPNKSLIVVSTTKRKYQEGYNRKECIEEHLNRNLEIMLELARYQEKAELTKRRNCA